MEFVPATEPELADILVELSARELILHRPEPGTSRSDFERMMVEDFWEIGASGRLYSKQQVLDVLEQRCAYPPEEAWETSDFHCHRLSSNTFLLTYGLVQYRVRRTRRATIWKKTPEGWKAVFHQGTLIQDE